MGFLFRLMVWAGVGYLAVKMIERERQELAQSGGGQRLLAAPVDAQPEPQPEASAEPSGEDEPEDDDADDEPAEAADDAPAAAPPEDFEARLAAADPPEDLAPAAGHFESVLQQLMDDARGRGQEFLDVNAGDLHRRVGGYPGPGARMEDCCRVMRAALKPGDQVLAEPAKGVGPSVTLRYAL